jgi:hypothetical protein
MINLMPDAQHKIGKRSSFKPADYKRTTTKIRPDLFDLLNEYGRRVGSTSYVPVNNALEYWFKNGCPIESGVATENKP